MTLDGAAAVRFARDHGLVSGADVTVSAMSGGVSNDTLLVDDGLRRVVVKRALPQLRTAVEWYASPTRAVDEAAALRLAGGVTPDRVPAVLAVDSATATIAVAAAPAQWRDWKGELLAGRVVPAMGTLLGATIGALHAATHERPRLLDGMDGMDRMESLRIAPFHDVIARRHPDLAGRVGEASEQLRAIRPCFVHGDFSPKNVLAPPQASASGSRRPGGLSPPEAWVIDFEVAHVGNPVFDLAYMHTHLLLKSLAHASDDPPLGSRLGTPGPFAPDLVGAALRETAASVTSSYRSALAESPLRPDAVLDELSLHTGCLLLARVDGTAVVDYLDEAATARARSLGRQLIAGETDVQQAWNEATGDR